MQNEDYKQTRVYLEELKNEFMDKLNVEDFKKLLNITGKIDNHLFEVLLKDTETKIGE